MLPQLPGQVGWAVPGSRGRKGGGGRCGMDPDPAAGRFFSLVFRARLAMGAHWAVDTSYCLDRVPHQVAGDRFLFAPP